MNQLINYLQERAEITFNELNVVRLVLLFLGAYSITRLVYKDDFPLFANPRKWLHKRFPPTDTVWDAKPPRGTWKRLPDNQHWVVIKGHWLGDLTDCPWCAGFWVSLAIWSSYFCLPLLTLSLLVPLSMRAFVGAFAIKHGG